MKTHLNTLFVTTQGAYLAKQGAAVAVRVQKETKLRIPLHNLESIVCFGRVNLSPQLMQACAEQGVSISLMSEHGRFRAAVVGFTAVGRPKLSGVVAEALVTEDPPFRPVIAMTWQRKVALKRLVIEKNRLRPRGRYANGAARLQQSRSFITGRRPPRNLAVKNMDVRPVRRGVHPKLRTQIDHGNVRSLQLKAQRRRRAVNAHRPSLQTYLGL